jgi:flagellar hook protein FlgE
MSLNSAMLSGVSGLIANSSALAAISDNIANVNTVGYKRNQVNFTDLVTSQSVKGRYSAGGVQGKPYQYVSQQGQIQSTSSSTDIAVSGDGFFVVANAASGVGADTRSYTRAGGFNVDSSGNLVNNAGLYLLGWPVDSSGAVDANPSDLTKLSAINVKNLGATVKPSTTAQITANLNADQTPDPVKLAAYNSATKSMAAYDATATPVPGTKPDYTMQMSVIDSKGGSHTVSVSFLKTANPNEWQAEIYGDPSEVTSGAGLAPGQIAAGLVKFTSDGQLDITGSNALTPKLFADFNDPSINIGASSATAPAAGTAQWTTALGVGGQGLAFDLTGAGGGLSQLSGPSGVKTISTNGAGVGNVTGVEIGADGFVSAVFDNGEVRKIAQIAVATFLNPDGLRAASGNAYTASIESGSFSLKKAGESGAGHIAGGALESSTVDLSSEFTGLIITQRAYSASSKIIMTADQMMEELINIKR